MVLLGLLEQTDLQDISKSKQTAFRIAWGKLEGLAARRMDELTIDNLQSCLDDKAQTYYPAKDMKTVLSHLFKRAVAEGNARTNPSRVSPLSLRWRKRKHSHLLSWSCTSSGAPTEAATLS